VVIGAQEGNMRRLHTQICLVVTVALFIVSVSAAQDCKEAKEMLDQTLMSPPNEMTEEYIQMSLQQCTNKADLYYRVMKYYKKWYKTEFNPKKQVMFKRLSEYYYHKAVSSNKGIVSRAVKPEITRVKSNYRVVQMFCNHLS